MALAGYFGQKTRGWVSFWYCLPDGSGADEKADAASPPAVVQSRWQAYKLMQTFPG